MKIMGTKTFVMEKDLEGQATKTLQEAAEFYEAVKKYLKNKDGIFDDAFLEAMVDEGADVIQTVLNFYDALGYEKPEVIEAMSRCLRRNQKRGRVK